MYVGPSCTKPAWLRIFEIVTPDRHEMAHGSRSMACVMARRRRADAIPLSLKATSVNNWLTFQEGGDRVCCALGADCNMHSPIMPAWLARETRTVLALALL